MEQLDVIIPLANLVPTSLRSRVDSINYILKTFFRIQSRINIQMIFVEQSLDDQIYYLDNINTCGLRTKKIEIGYPMFNKPWCQNVGFKASESEYIMMADSDILSYSDYLADLVAWARKKNLKWAFGWNELYYTDYLEKRAVVYRSAPKIDMHEQTVFSPSHGVNEGGFVLFRRDFYDEIGMGNEFILELGGPDNELAKRSRAVSKTYEAYPAFIFHLYHEQTSKSMRPTRKQNVGTYRLILKDMQKAIGILKGFEPGGSKPYSDGKVFADLMGYKKSGRNLWKKIA